MNARDFILQTINLHQSARRVLFPDPKIRRGRSHSISSGLEDLFAKFLAENIRCDEILIDQPLSVPGIKGLAYPDTAIIQRKEIVAFCDLKSALGWNRKTALLDICRKHYRWLRQARGKDCESNDGVTKKRLAYKISRHATYSVVVMTDRNINPALLRRQISLARKYSPLVDVFVLTNGAGLNDYGFGTHALFKKVKIREDEFRRLLRRVSGNKRSKTK